MWFGKFLHFGVGFVVEDQGEGEGFGDGLVGYVVVPERGVLDCA